MLKSDAFSRQEFQDANLSRPAGERSQGKHGRRVLVESSRPLEPVKGKRSHTKLALDLMTLGG
jgi:hypothetical protein